jgi:ABC-2 type transport system ATP-binding protein
MEFVSVASVPAASVVRHPVAGADVQPVIRVSGLRKRFPVRRGWAETLRHPLRREYAAVLQDVSFDVRTGEFFGLLGPNGAGKTTLFKTLSGMVLPDGGRAEVMGFDVVREIGRVHQVLTPASNEERSLFWRLPAWENLRAYAALHGLRGALLNARVQEVLDAVELADTGTKMVGQSSSGMKQRLLIARALLARPRVLLLDEPTRSLDPISARRFRIFLRDVVVAKHGCTVLLATHNAEEALELCDRIGILDRGRMLRVDTPQQLMRELGENRYRVWVRDVDWPAFHDMVVSLGIGVPLPLGGEEPGWTEAEVPVPGGLESASEVVREVAAAGIRLGRFEPVRLSLAEMIEKVVERREHEDADRV